MMAGIRDSTRILAVLDSVQEHKRLTGVVEALTREIKRLDEDNAQLRAAIAAYREAVKRYAVTDGNGERRR